MDKKTFQLVTGIVTGVATIASAVVVAGIEIAAGAVIEICTLFVKSE